MAGETALPVVATSACQSAQLVSVSGRLGADDTEALGAMLAGLAHGTWPVVVDLTDAILIDAAVARVLKQSMAACGREGIFFAAAGAQGQPFDVLEILGMAKELGAHLSVSEALSQAERDRARGGRLTLDATVHRLLEPARALEPGDPMRRRAQEQAIEVALPLARSMAHRYQQRGEPLDDLIQVASLGVVRAVQGYDADRGSGFLAYAVPTILGELRRHFRDHAWIVRAPRRLQEIRTAITRSGPDLAQHLGREPNAADFARHTGFTLTDVEQAILTSSGLQPTSLDAPGALDTDRCLYEIVGAPDAEIDMIDFRVSIKPLIAAETPAVQEILMLRFVRDLTQAEIARRVGTSQMNVSRVLRAVLARFKRALLASG